MKCPACDGFGYVYLPTKEIVCEPPYETCSKCGGSGTIVTPVGLTTKGEAMPPWMIIFVPVLWLVEKILKLKSPFGDATKEHRGN